MLRLEVREQLYPCLILPHSMYLWYSVYYTLCVVYIFGISYGVFGIFYGVFSVLYGVFGIWNSVLVFIWCIWNREREA